MQEPIAFARALADANRWRIIHLVFERALCVCELADVLKLPQSTLSSHLRVIQDARMLDCERREKWLFYRVKPEYQPLLRALFRHFDTTRESVSALARDARRAEARVTRREESCCPAPEILVTRNHKLKA